MRRQFSPRLPATSIPSSASVSFAEKAAATLADLGYNNVHVLHGDGTQGMAGACAL